MINAIFEALTLISRPETLAFLLIGSLAGLVVGVLPGLGGTVGMSVLLPFVYGMDPASGIALLIGMVAVTHTSDTFPSVLMGIPGSSGSQATILDGYPLAQRGEAGRALGAAFSASLIGGIVGALGIIGAVYVARPIVLSLGSPELLMLAVLGLSVVGILSTGNGLAGVVAALFGLFLGSVGNAPAHPTPRFTADSLYLMDGIPLPVVALALFAIPEIIDLLADRRSVSAVAEIRGSRLAGVLDVLRNRWLVLRSAILGVFVGIIPGLGGSVVDWISYGFARQTLKDSGGFGDGDIRGVIAPESSNNAKEGGTLIPALLFGIPGSGSSAMMLGGLILLDVRVGPDMVGVNLPITMSIVWSLALANIIATTLCFSLTTQVSKIATIPAQKLMPFLISIIVLAAYQSSRQWGDIYALVVLGLLGWVMKQTAFPRPAVLIGFVLGAPVERYLRLSIDIYGSDWVTRPGVIAIAIVIVLTLGFGGRRVGSAPEKQVPSTGSGEHSPKEA